MAIQPPAGTCCISLTNVVVIDSTATTKLHFTTFVNFLFQPGESAQSTSETGRANFPRQSRKLVGSAPPKVLLARENG
jgi:hypothetical protein